jgi:hypothetical protein
VIRINDPRGGLDPSKLLMLSPEAPVDLTTLGWVSYVLGAAPLLLTDPHAAVALNNHASMFMRPFGILAATVMVMASAVACSGGASSTPTTPDSPSLRLQGLPVNLAAVDFAAVVTRRDGRDADWRPLDDYGRIYSGNSANPTPKANPQPTFFAPLGTPVLAVVSGTVSGVPTLYSNDYSVMIQSPGSGGTWEHEHVINVRVRVGDRVTVGQHIADVSNYECVWGRNNSPTDPLCQSGLGLVELGLLYPGNPPSHRCPFETDVVDPARRAEIFGQLDSARMRIKTAMRNPNLFGESSWATPQCVTLTRIAG